MKAHVALLRRLGACDGEATEWAASQRSARAAWDNCKRADWMLWVLGRLAGAPASEPRRQLVLCACECAETALKHIKDDETLAIATAAIQTAQAWAHGEAGIDDVRDAAAYATAAAYAATTAAADAAAAADAYAATTADADAAADAAAYAAADAAATAAAYAAADAAATAAADAAAYAAADAAAYAAADAAARSRALATMAEIVRRHYPDPPPLNEPKP